MSLVTIDKKHEDAEWDAHKATIQHLYLSEDMPLQTLIQTMADSHSFGARYV